MVTTSLGGGLGNYLFQIASAYSLALDNGDECVFDMDNSVKVHKHISTYENNILRNIKFNNFDVKNEYNEPYFHYNKIPYLENIRLNGYFQSEKYFNHNRDKILDLFSISEECNKYIQDKYGEILKEDTCSIHVRRGDYLNLQNFHPLCELDYYEKAIKQFPVNTKFLVFSDDIDWCKKSFKDNNFIFIEGNKDYIDMWVMSLCKDNIICNSTFSWWSAYLNKNKNKKVVAPNKWFGDLLNHDTKDLIPESWVKM